jgi:hypothetical protein
VSCGCIELFFTPNRAWHFIIYRRSRLTVRTTADRSTCRDLQRHWTGSCVATCTSHSA